MSMTSPLTLYHATDMALLDVIAQEGMKPNSYWTSNSELAAYYQDSVEDEGKTCVLLAIQVKGTLGETWIPDYPGLEEPISTVIGMDEEETMRAWGAVPGPGTGQDSLDLIGSTKCTVAISPHQIFRVELGPDEDGHLCPLVTPSLETSQSRKRSPGR